MDISFDVVEVVLPVPVVLPEPVMLIELVELTPVVICGDVIVLLPLSDVVVLLDVAAFPAVMLESLLAALVVSFCTSLVVVTSPVSKSKVAIEPLAENVPPPVAFAVVPVVLLELVVFDVEVVLLALLVLVESDGGVYCAIAGARLNAAAKSPATSTNATVIGAFFIAKSVQK